MCRVFKGTIAAQGGHLYMNDRARKTRPVKLLEIECLYYIHMSNQKEVSNSGYLHPKNDKIIW